MSNTIGLEDFQEAHARTIINVGKERGASDRDIEISLMVALDESGLQNYANSKYPPSLGYPHDAIGSDHGSVGLFQQQSAEVPTATANWGPVSVLMDPASSALKFFQALSKLGNTTGEDPWTAAQQVQGSDVASGSNYQREWTRAVIIYQALNSPVPEDETMATKDLIVTADSGNEYVVAADLTSRVHISGPSASTALAKTGLYVKCDFGDAQLALIPQIGGGPKK